MNRALHIAVIGYGIAGISAAILLRRRGHEVVHFERAAPAGSAGAGLLLHGSGLSVLQRLGMGDSCASLGARVTRIHGETLHGRRVMDLSYDDAAAGTSGLGIQRGALLTLLKQSDPYSSRLHTSCRITAVDAERGQLFENAGRCHGPFDLIVGADGANSTIRSEVKAVVRRDRLSPWAALVCLLDDADNVGRDLVFQSYNGTRHAAIWPVGALAQGAPRRINVSLNVSPGQAAELQDVHRWKRYVANLCPRIAPLLDQIVLSGDLLLFRYRDVELCRYYSGRVVLIGDAAHSMSPQLGQGASLALLDAMALAEALVRRDDVSSALANFDGERRAHVTRYQCISRWLTPFFQSDSRALAMLRDRAFYPMSQVPFIRRTVSGMLSGKQYLPGAD